MSEKVSRRDRSAQLLDIALELIVTGGYRSLSMAAIAEAAGVSRPIVYRSYPNLQALLIALLRREQRRAEKVLDEVVPSDPGGRHPRDLLLDALRGLLGAVERYPLTWRLVLLPPEGTPKPVQALVDRRREGLVRRTRKLVDWGLPHLGDSADLDAELLARVLLSIAQENARIVLTDPAVDAAQLLASAEGLLAAVPWVTPRTA
jgi:AcrR family transcriptional regulator